MQLRQLFTHIDPLDERAKAATCIAAGIRGFLARRRYAVFNDCVINWKWGRCRVFVAVLQHMTKIVSRFDKGVHRMKMKRETILVRTVLFKWYQVCAIYNYDFELNIPPEYLSLCGCVG